MGIELPIAFDPEDYDDMKLSKFIKKGIPREI